MNIDEYRDLEKWQRSQLYSNNESIASCHKKI